MRNSLRAGVVSVLLLASTMAANAAVSNASSRAFQQTVVDGLTHAIVCVDSGRYGEAEAYAKMVLGLDAYKLFVDWDSLPAHRQADGRKAVQDAVDAWTCATGGEISFEFVPRSQADVHISFSNELTFVGQPAGGIAVWRRNVIHWSGDRFTPQLRATIRIALKTGRSGPNMTVEQMTHATMHELGHILGLRDSPRRGTVMGPLDLNNPVLYPAESEVRAILEVRSEAWSVMRMAAMRSDSDVELQAFLSDDI